tara:strand:+ start:390 stop:602 length:213 start_codon:yes stop_codon:yes gene_type:complete
MDAPSQLACQTPISSFPEEFLWLTSRQKPGGSERTIEADVLVQVCARQTKPLPVFLHFISQNSAPNGFDR